MHFCHTTMKCHLLGSFKHCLNLYKSISYFNILSSMEALMVLLLLLGAHQAKLKIMADNLLFHALGYQACSYLIPHELFRK